jgi:transposase
MVQLTYEQLLEQNQILIQQLQEALEEIRLLKIENQKLRDENQQLKDEIAELKEKLGTNSSNSSKPPSQDPFRARKTRKQTGRSQGAQKGHGGHSRQLLPLSQVQILHDLKPNICPYCQLDSFDTEIVRTEVRQVVELPEAPPEVTQYNIHTCRCNLCGKHVKADIPKEARFGFGPRLMGLVTSLSGEFRLSKRQVTALMGKIGIRICSGSVCNIHSRASQILKGPYEEIKKHTLSQDHLNADESSWKTLKKKKWIWVGCTLDSVFFSIQASRSGQAFQEVFGSFKGGLTTDRYDVYNLHEGTRQLCWSHTDRDFEKIASRDGFDKWIGQTLLQCKSQVFDLWHHFKDGHMTRDELIKKIEEGPKEDIRVLFKAGACHEDCRNKTKSTCIDYLNRFDMLWVFIYKENLEPTNNLAERCLRHGVIWRKLSYGSQSEEGERFVERVMSVAMTLKQRAQNSFDYFTNCFRAFIFGEHPPPIFTG